jgi:hypothetical protein
MCAVFSKLRLDGSCAEKFNTRLCVIQMHYYLMQQCIAMDMIAHSGTAAYSDKQML